MPAERFTEIVKVRNRLAKAAGFRNYYDMKLQQAEGFSLEVLFGMLDGLEQQTRPIMEAGGLGTAHEALAWMAACSVYNCATYASALPQS